MSLFGFRAPCDEPALRQDERLSRLLDDPSEDATLAAHVAGCERCGAALRTLRADRVGLGALGDVAGAAPDEGELRRVLAAVSLDRAARRSPVWMAWAAAAAALAVAAGLGARQLVLLRTRATDDAAILAGAEAAFRRAEHEYTEAIAMLRAQLDGRGAVDPRVAEGARALDDARAKAAALVAERRGDAEREALLRDALRAEVRYYEDALMRAGVAPEPAR